MKKHHILLGLIIILGVWWFLSNSPSPSAAFETSASGEYGINVGDSFPVFTYTTITGETITSLELEGKVVLITSSAYWCGTCIAEAQELAQAYQLFDEEDVYFLTIDIDPRSSIRNIAQFRFENNTPWDYTDAGGGSEVIDSLKMNRFEITYIVNQEGVITYKDSHITSTEEAETALRAAQ